MEIIVGKQGNQKIAITDSSVSRKHCKLTEQPDGTYILEDLNSTNGTFVGGKSVIRTVVTRDTIIQLGGYYSAKVDDLVGAKFVQQPQQPFIPQQPKTEPKPQPVPEFSIYKLQRIWDDYQNVLEEIKNRQKGVNNLRMIAPLFTMASGALSCFMPGAGVPLLVVGLCLTAYAFLKSSKDNSDEERKEALEKFQSNYVCPNPKCGKSLSQSPKILLINKTCPYCKCKFTE